MTYARLAQLRSPDQFAAHIQALGIELDFDETLLASPESPLAQPYHLPACNLQLSNRWCILPMKGWDGTTDGKPTELTLRCWQRFGHSGAKLIWGGEATAICPEGRANPRQLIIHEANLSGVAQLRESLIRAHAQRWHSDELLIGLQLTHSGRFCRPNDDKRLEPRILYRHPLLDRKFNLPPDYPPLSDDDVERLIDQYIVAARLAQKAGFTFVDISKAIVRSTATPGPNGGRG